MAVLSARIHKVLGQGRAAGLGDIDGREMVHCVPFGVFHILYCANVLSLQKMSE